MDIDKISLTRQAAAYFVPPLPQRPLMRAFACLGAFSESGQNQEIGGCSLPSFHNQGVCAVYRQHEYAEPNKQQSKSEPIWEPTIIHRQFSISFVPCRSLPIVPH
jgi:hypothetical protein